MWLKGCSQECELKWPAQGKECHLLTESGSAPFVSQQKRLLPRLSASSAILSTFFWKAFSASSVVELVLLLKVAHSSFSHSCWTRRESIITSLYACFVNLSINLGLLEHVKYCVHPHSCYIYLSLNRLKNKLISGSRAVSQYGISTGKCPFFLAIWLTLLMNLNRQHLKWTVALYLTLFSVLSLSLSPAQWRSWQPVQRRRGGWRGAWMRES